MENRENDYILGARYRIVGSRTTATYLGSKDDYYCFGEADLNDGRWNIEGGILEFSVKLDHELISMPKSKDRFVVGKRYYLTEKGKINGVYSHNEDGRDYFKDVLDPESHFILKQDNTISFSDGHPLESYREYPTAVELTLQEIADKFGISVNQLRIIK